MITEDYVSFETAKLLKEKGFDERCHKIYEENGARFSNSDYLRNSESDGCLFTEGPYEDSTRTFVTAPTLQMAMKWLREVHKLHCNIDLSEGSWKPNIIQLDNWSCVDDGSIPICDTYEEATEAAIKYCLESKLILNGVD